MKQGKSLIELATEIERQKTAAQDFVADSRSIVMLDDATLTMRLDTREPMPIADTAHRQIGDRTKIPAIYYDRMLKDAPDLLADNVNRWFQEQPERRMLRTLDGRLRAFLSDRYQRIDNHHVANVVLPILLQTPGIEVMSTEITERRMYIKAVTHKVQAEVKSRRVGDIVEAGIIISNSEIGMGSLSVLPFFHFLVCTNGMVRNKDGLRKYHVGKRNDIIEGEFMVLSDNTKRLEDAATLSKVGDVMRSALDQVQFNEAVERMQAATADRIMGSPVKAIEVLGQSFGFAESERTDVLRHLIEGGDLSRYGLMNAVTRTAADLSSYDRATEFETMGGAILDITPANWSRIAEAA